MSPESRTVAGASPPDMTGSIRSGFSALVEKEARGADPYEDRGLSLALIAAGVLIGSFLVAHQARSTGLFTASFGTTEMLLLYGTLLFWIVTSALIVVGKKDLSRDLDLGGLVVAAGAAAWLLVVFPFDFAHVADMWPASLGFLGQWISDDIARAVLVLSFVVHMGLAVFSVTLRVSVYRTRARQHP